MYMDVDAQREMHIFHFIHICRRSQRVRTSGAQELEERAEEESRLSLPTTHTAPLSEFSHFLASPRQGLVSSFVLELYLHPPTPCHTSLPSDSPHFPVPFLRLASTPTPRIPLVGGRPVWVEMHCSSSALGIRSKQGRGEGRVSFALCFVGPVRKRLTFQSRRRAESREGGSWGGRD